MNTTSWLTVIGLVSGLADYAATQQIYPQYTSAISGFGLFAMGILAKGIDKR